MPLFTTTYQPKNTSQIFGQDLPLAQVKNFINTYKTQKLKALLLEGPHGVGKTATIYAIAKELDCDLLELNSSEDRSEQAVRSFLNNSLNQQSLFFKPKIILLDEVDNLSGTLDRGAVSAIVDSITKSKFPIILTANDTSDSKFKPLQKACLKIQYPELDYKAIAHTLLWVCEQEKIKTDDKTINTLARQSGGDLRAALIDLQTIATSGPVTYDRLSSLTPRKRTETILNALTLIFKSSKVENALPALDDIDVEINEVFLWLDHNLPQEYTKPESLAKAYESLARADIFQARIMRRQHWRFLSYVTSLLTAGISSAKTERNTAFVQYKQTMRLLKIWQMKQKNAKRKEIAQKLANTCHMSKHVAFTQVPYLPFILKTNPNLSQELNLTPEETEYLEENTPIIRKYTTNIPTK